MYIMQYILEDDYREAIARKGKLMASLQTMLIEYSLRTEDSYLWGGTSKSQVAANMSRKQLQIMEEIKKCDRIILQYKMQ